MEFQERIDNAASRLPNEIAIIVLSDIDKRISDWKCSGGKDTDPYIEQQVRYIENVVEKLGITEEGKDRDEKSIRCEKHSEKSNKED